MTAISNNPINPGPNPPKNSVNVPNAPHKTREIPTINKMLMIVNPIITLFVYCPIIYHIGSSVIARLEQKFSTLC